MRLPSFCHMAAGDFELVPLWQREFVGAALSLHSSVYRAILWPNFSYSAPNAQIKREIFSCFFWLTVFSFFFSSQLCAQFKNRKRAKNLMEPEMLDYNSGWILEQLAPVLEVDSKTSFSALAQPQAPPRIRKSVGLSYVWFSDSCLSAYKKKKICKRTRSIGLIPRFFQQVYTLYDRIKSVIISLTCSWLVINFYAYPHICG